MFAYHLRLAWLSLRSSPVLAVLMVAAVGVGVGVCVTMLTVYHLMSGNPIPSKSDQLYRVQVDSWDPDEPYTDRDGKPNPPDFMTWRDVQALLPSDIPTRHAAMYRTTGVVEPENPDVAPTSKGIRATTRDFFGMFDVPFLFGAAWSSQDDEGRQVVVISRRLNEEVFGGEDSTGRTLRISGALYRVTGVMDTWNPLPKFYDANYDRFGEAEEVFLPLQTAVDRQMQVNGNISCWKPEPIDDWQAFLNSECVWLMYWAELPGPAQVAAYRDFLDAYAMEQKALGRFPRPLNNTLRDVMDWLEYLNVVGDDSVVLVGLSFLFLAVCLLNAVGLLLARFIGAAPRVGLRRALGASRGMVLRQHLVEVSLIGVAGGLVGLGVATIGLWLIRRGWEDLERLTSLDLTMTVGGIALAVAASLLAGLWPAWRLCRIPPGQYLRTQ
jgi:putative ABC transport system permease protein